MTLFNLSGRKALITGAGQGMGFGIAKALAQHGVDVYINDLYADRAEAAANSIKATSVAGDITNAETRQFIATEIGPLDILVHNAGVPEGMSTSLARASELSEADYARQMDLNHHAVRELCYLFLPYMQENNHGRILIITSEAHRIGLPMGLSHYAAAKAATLGYMRAIAAEYGHDGVTVNALSLGTMNNFDGHERAAASTLIGRAGNPDDVGAAALYLCSDEAGWMTGQTLPLNGGSCTA